MEDEAERLIFEELLVDEALCLKAGIERVRCCPICGERVERTCHHEGEGAESVEMPLEEAFRLRREQIGQRHG